MSLLNYFQRAEKSSHTKPSDVCESMKNNLPKNMSSNELEKVHESLKVVEAQKERKRTLYAEKDKQEIARYASVSGATAAFRKFRPKFPHLTETTVRPWLKSYKESLKKKNLDASHAEVKIGKTSGRPLLLDETLDIKIMLLATLS